MTDFLAWSHSRRKTYLDCPRQLWHNIAPKGHPDRVEYVQTAAMAAGNEVDDALTNRIGKGTPLPTKFAPYEPLAQIVLAAPGTKYTQLKVTFDQQFQTCGWFDKQAWLRSAYDVAIVNGAHAFIGDWKNGALWPDSEQLRLFAATAFMLFPEVDVIDTSYIWLKHGVTTDETYHRRELTDLWQTFLPDVERMQISHRTNHWPATPARGAKTCAYCPANKAGKCKEALGPPAKEK